MIGSNTLILNHEEMKRAVGYYLDKVQLNEPIKVVSVTGIENVFHIVFEEFVEE